MRPQEHVSASNKQKQQLRIFNEIADKTTHSVGRLFNHYF